MILENVVGEEVKVSSQSNVSFGLGTHDTLFEVSFNNWVYRNYEFNLNDYRLEVPQAHTAVSKIEDCFGKLEKHYIKQGSLNLTVYLHKDFIIRTFRYKDEKILDLNIAAKDLGTLETVTKIINQFENEVSDSEIQIDYFYYSNNRLSTNASFKTIEDFNLNSGYYPYLATEEMFEQYFLSDDNIMLLAGKPGTGKSALVESFMEFLLKSSFVRKVIEKSDPLVFKVGYIKNEKILSDDQFWVQLQEGSYDLIILDDLDYSLLPRTQEISTQEDIDKNKFISNLLSFTDGIFEENSKTKFMITTNKEVSEIDTAILRKGRTFDILNLRALKIPEAKIIWEREELDINIFENLIKGKTEILACDLGSEISEVKSSIKFNTDRKSYVLEDNISLYNKSKQVRKVGF